MLRERTIINIADNSGANNVMLFAINGQNGRGSVSVGDICKGSVKKSSVGGKIKKKQKVDVLIVRTRRKVTRKDGSVISFTDNAGVVVNKATKEAIGTRVFGPIAREIRELGFNKIVSMAEEVW